MVLAKEPSHFYLLFSREMRAGRVLVTTDVSPVASLPQVNDLHPK